MISTLPELSPKQLDFLLNSDADINIADGAVRSGKTHIFNLRWLEYIMTAPPGDLLMAGKTVRTLEQNVLKAKNGLFDLLGQGNYQYNSSTGILHVAGRTIYCKGANDEQAENKIRGMTLAGALCDEVTLFPKSFIDQLIARCSVAGAKQFWNCNPDSPFHYIKQMYLDSPDMKDTVKHWRFLMTDNPYLTRHNPQYIQNASRTWKGVFYRRNVLGEWALADGLIYAHFDNSVHVVRELPKTFDNIYIAIDYGTTHPTAFIMLGKLGDKVYVIKEYYQSGRLNSQLADDLVAFKEGFSITGITVDSAAASFILELRARGIHVKDCIKDVHDGISKVSSLLGESKLFVHESCLNLIKEFFTYSWDTKKSVASGKDVVIKLNDDAMDALRYGIMTFYNHKKPGTFNRGMLGL